MINSDDLSRKVRIKAEQIARARVAGFKDEMIASMFNLTRSGLSRILALPEYQEEEARVRQEVLTQADSKLSAKANKLVEEFESQNAVPEALKAMLDTVRQNKDLKARMVAAQEILDRDPSRTFVKPRDAAAGQGAGAGAGTFQLPKSLLKDSAEQSAKVATGIDAMMPIQPVGTA